MLKGQKILVTRDFPENGLDLLRNEGAVLEVRSSENPFTYDELLSYAVHFDILLCSSKEKIDRTFLENNKHLKVISQYAAGFDNIDIDAATELGIPLGHTPNAMNNATSDIAFGLMIAVSRDFFQMHKKIASDEWGDFRPQANLGIELYGKTLGIFGLGAIGFEMARKCKAAYGMKIIYHNRSENAKAKAELNAAFVDFDTLLSQSDVLSVHADLNEKTKYLFDIHAFQKMKPESLFINTARGQIHQEKDLLTALQKSYIRGAGLDVTDPEPMHSENPLLYMPNVCVLPHIGSATVESRAEMSRLAAENIIQFFKTGKMVHCINPQVLK